MSKELNGIVKVWEATVRKSSHKKKRASSLFTPMSVAHVDDEEPKPGEISHVEKIFPNGDFYTGQWVDNIPHGQGKYLWTDGCMYVGQWRKGKNMGKGRFSWPSGATYEGEFKNGFMDGKGTYTGVAGYTYKGSWVMNLKHGQGTKSYPNGDYYEGEWRRGLQDGHGRYQWKNGNHYIGNWKNGVFHGNGTLMWNNGNRYDGCWEDGLPNGNGTFRWADGSSYVGVWSQDSKARSGTYYPSGNSSPGTVDWDPQEVYSVDLKQCKICPCEKVFIFPSQKNLNVPGFEEDSLQNQVASKKGNRWVSVDGRLSNYSCDSSDGSSAADGDRKSREGFESFGNSRTEDSVSRAKRHPPNLKLKPPKRQGETISKGHKNYELMLNLQLGIRY